MATTPMRIVMTAATKAVPAASWASVPGGLALDRMAGLRTRMELIEKKVTIPPRTSREMVEPRSVMRKYRSSQDAVPEEDEDFVGVRVLTAAFFQIVTR